MNEIRYDFNSGKTLYIGHTQDHNATMVKFDYTPLAETNAVYLQVGEPINTLIPLDSEHRFIVQSILTENAGKFSANIVELEYDGEKYNMVFKSPNFNLQVLQSNDITEEKEVTSPSLELVYAEINADIQQLKSDKMEFYEVTFDGTHIVKDGVVQTYAMLKEKFDNPKYWLYLHYVGVNYLPLGASDITDYLQFNAQYDVTSGLRYESISIDGDDVVTTNRRTFEVTDNKASSINSRNRNSETIYPSVKAVTSYVDSNKYDDTEIKNEVTSNSRHLAEVDTELSNKVEKEAGKGLFSGNYNDLTNKPTIPPQYDDTEIKRELTSQKEDLAQKITKPIEAPTVGKILKVKSVNADGTFVCEWADDNGGAVDDVQINGQSIVVDGVADIPYAGNNKVGVVKFPDWCGIRVEDNTAYIFRSDESIIRNRNTDSNAYYRALTPITLDYAVKSALCDGKGAEYTEAEKKSARERIGADGGKFELIEEMYLTDKDSFVSKQSEPNGTPYNFKDMIIEITIPAGNEQGEINLNFWKTTSTASEYRIGHLYSGSVSAASNNRKAYAISRNQNGCRDNILINTSGVNSNRVTNEFLYIDGSPIKYFTMTGSVCSKASVIKIYAIRA